MQNDMRDRLVELIAIYDETYDCETCTSENKGGRCGNKCLADYLIENGVIVLDMNVISPKNRPLITHFANMPLNDVLDIIKADVVPVVRCCDCKHLMFSDCYGECSKGYMGIVSPNDYCSYGEREENK